MTEQSKHEQALRNTFDMFFAHEPGTCRSCGTEIESTVMGAMCPACQEDARRLSQEAHEQAQRRTQYRSEWEAREGYDGAE